MEELTAKGFVSVEELAKDANTEMKPVAGYHFYCNLEKADTPFSYSDFMVYDWVAVRTKFLECYESNNALGGHYVYSTKACRCIGVMGNTVSIEESYSEPALYYGIPITYDILEQNGWETPFSGGFSSQYETSKGDVCITLDAIRDRLDIRIGGKNFDFPKPMFVHQLQQSLRLCGLSNIANEFKV